MNWRKTYEEKIIPLFLMLQNLQKVKAKIKKWLNLQLKILANYLWNQDKDKKIKI